MGNPVYLRVDASDLSEKIEALRAVHTKHEFELLMYRAFKRTGGRVKTILKQDIPKEYFAKPSWIGSTVGNPKTNMGGIGGAGVSCCIPIDGTRGVLGQQFAAAGPRGRRGKGKAYKITAKMVKSGASTLPATMDSYGGQPPFFAPGLGQTVFTRKSKARLPIVRVVGIGVPQMPVNRSEKDVQEDILDTLKKRIEHEHAYLISRCR